MKKNMWILWFLGFLVVVGLVTTVGIGIFQSNRNQVELASGSTDIAQITLPEEIDTGLDVQREASGQSNEISGFPAADRAELFESVLGSETYSLEEFGPQAYLPGSLLGSRIYTSPISTMLRIGIIILVGAFLYRLLMGPIQERGLLRFRRGANTTDQTEN